MDWGTAIVFTILVFIGYNQLENQVREIKEELEENKRKIKKMEGEKPDSDYEYDY